MTRSMNLLRMLLSSLCFAFALQLSALVLPHSSHALCATVKIEIQQELTLERQAFDAHMRINNNLSGIPIENVAVSVTFADENGNPVLASSNPDDTSALFFYRIDSMDNIDDVTGSGSVAPETSADIHWLIIPAPGASNGLESGTLYLVGATLTYTAAGQSESITVTPDYIYVKPMPQLVLDYFLPKDIYGDDAWSTQVEPPVPFYLGLRVSNKGAGYARSLKIESAQPKIVDNEMGLLIGFQIEGSTVNGQPATDSLLVDFGDIAPHSAGMARWIMSCTLSGRFVDFSAEFSHSDELGGKMTSLIAEDDVHTHFLVHSVLVDAPGRDSIEDFLANDDDVYRVFESDDTDTDVTDQSSAASLSSQSGGGYRLTAPPTSGFMYARVTDPTAGGMLIKDAIRSDGKHIKPANVWFSKTRAGSGPWQYYLNIFDYNTPGTYTITFQSPAAVAQAPVIMEIPERTRVEGQQLSFIVEASDPNGTTPALAAEMLPVGATFQDQGNGSGVFDWTPAVGQAGRYVVKFIATDGVLESSRQAVVRIFSQSDSDGDGMPDNWETQHFGNLDRDGSGDFDHDGISDLDEYLNGLDPCTAQSVPSVPEIMSPEDGGHVATLTPTLQIADSIDPEGDDIHYAFEVYADKEFKHLAASQADIAEQAVSTTWTLPAALTDNSFYYWRVKAFDASGSSNWAYGRFFTDTQNDPPSAPAVSFPADGMSVDTQTPTLEIVNSIDPDDEALTYVFQVYADSGMGTKVADSGEIPAGADLRTAWTVADPLQNGYWYYWRAMVKDGRGGVTAGPLASFQINTSNHAPQAPAIQAPQSGAEITTDSVDLAVGNATDADGDALTYIFELDTDPHFASPAKLRSEPISPMTDGTAWPVASLTDNTRYYWRVKSTDGVADSRWAEGDFFVNAVNEAPSKPELKNPGMGAWVDTQTPTLSVHPATDPDQDSLSYRFEIYTDPDLNHLAGYAEVNASTWDSVSTLQPDTWYYWRAQAVDEHGIAGEWSDTGSFFVKLNGTNFAPQISFVTPDQAIDTNAQGISIHWSDTDPDSNASIALYYDTDDSGADGTLIAGGIAEDQDGTADYYTWDIRGLEGTYYLYAVISDSASSTTVYCPYPITIDRTPPTVAATPPGGAFTEPFQVALSADEAADIYYTLDGSAPGTGSAIYSGPLTISQETTLRFMAVDKAGNAGAAVTQTYQFQSADIAVKLSTDKDRVLAGTHVYAFTAAGSYTGHSAVTDGNGEAHFDPAVFAAGDYKFRIDYLRGQYWSQTVNLPDTRSIAVIIDEELVTVPVTTAAGPAAGVKVYLFDESGNYLGQYLVTDADGQVSFYLPVGMQVLFRADLYGSQYWSDVTAVSAGTADSAPVNAGGGQLRVAVEKSLTEPIAGVQVFLFDTAGNSLGHSALTDAQGHASFDVPAGDYRILADYLGYQFWSTDTQVVTDTLATLLLAHQHIQISVQSRFQDSVEPLEGIRVYLCSASGSYLGISLQTDQQGRVFIDLPEKSYKVRADVLGRQFWSDEFTWQDPVVDIPMSDARLTVGGAGHPLENVQVYLYSDDNSYLGRSTYTDANGQCLFRVPAGVYKFRADYQGSQFWTAVTSLAADQLQDIAISTGGGSFVFSLLAGPDQPLSGAACYLFSASGSYLGQHGVTDGDGKLTFDLADGDYQFRVDHLGYQFWSDPLNVPAALATTMTIAHTPVDVTVNTAAGPAPGVRVYLFKEDGTNQGLYVESDTQGRAQFDLPAGVSYQFRADILGSQYWSDVLQVPSTGPAAAEIDAGGGQLQLTVQDGDGAPMTDLKVYLFNGDVASLGLQQTTDAAGMVAFDVPAGAYKLRVDYLGNSFWTDAVQVTDNTQVTLPIPHQHIIISVQGQYQGVNTPLPGIRVTLFSPTGAYLGRCQDTDTGGQAAFDLPDRSYKVRADYMGGQYWSDTFSGQDAAVIIPMAAAQVDVTGAGLPKEGINVYLFSEFGAYLGVQATTSAGGRADFSLPAGTYRFRADYQNNSYWSGPQAMTAEQINPVIISVGGGTFTFNVRRDASTPMANVRCYVFNEAGAYLGLSGASDDQGQAFFDLADGTFEFRADYLGYSFWSQPVTVPDALNTVLEISHQNVTVALSGVYLGSPEPLGDQPLYLFTSDGGYTGITHQTDSGGRAVFVLPDQPYRIRADYLGAQYWSETFRQQDTQINIAQGAVDLHVQRNSTAVPGVRVYLFASSGAYLGRYVLTDDSGWAAFILPAGGYRFRVDVDGLQYWTGDVNVSADQTNTIEVKAE